MVMQPITVDSAEHWPVVKVWLPARPGSLVVDILPWWANRSCHRLRNHRVYGRVSEKRPPYRMSRVGRVSTTQSERLLAKEHPTVACDEAMSMLPETWG